MSNLQNYKFHSTNQYRNVVKNIKHSAQYKGFDEENQEPIMDYSVVAPTLTYIGTVKLHGTNASVVVHEDGDISFHSKNNILGYVRDGEFHLLSDNAEFAQTMWRRKNNIQVVCVVLDNMLKNNLFTKKELLKLTDKF